MLNFQSQWFPIFLILFMMFFHSFELKEICMQGNKKPLIFENMPTEDY